MRPEFDVLAFRRLGERLGHRGHERLAQSEGHGLERMVAQLDEHRSRMAVGDFPLTARIDGFWDRGDTEVDLVAVNADDGRIRFGTCKRNADALVGDLANLRRHAERFLDVHPAYRSWEQEFVAIAPRLPTGVRNELHARGALAQDLDDLLGPLRRG